NSPTPGRANSATAPPAWLMRPIFRPLRSVNHTLPSGLDVIFSGALLAVGTAYSVRAPAAVSRATLLAFFSVHQMLPFGAGVMPVGAALAVGRGASSVRVEGTQRSSRLSRLGRTRRGAGRVRGRQGFKNATRSNSDSNRFILHPLHARARRGLLP